MAGRADLIEEVSQAMTAVGVGRHVGPSFGLTRLLLQGLYLAPAVVASAMQGAVHLAALFSLAGYETAPLPDGERGDIVQLVSLKSRAKLEAFCRAIQSASPIDSFVTPSLRPCRAMTVTSSWPRDPSFRVRPSNCPLTAPSGFLLMFLFRGA